MKFGKSPYQLLIFIQLFLLWSTTCSSQLELLKTIKIDNHGYSAEKIKKLFIDADGFYWYSTLEGLVKTDGLTNWFFTFNHPDLKTVYTNGLTQTNDNKIIASTSGGIFILNLNTGEKQWLFTKLKSRDTNKIINFSSAIDGNSGDLWLGANSYKIIKNNNGKQSYYSHKTTLKRAPIVVDVLKNNTVIYREYNNWFCIINDQVIPIAKLNSESNADTYRSAMITNGLVFPENESGSYIFNNKRYSYVYSPEIDTQIFEIPFTVNNHIDINSFHKYNDDVWRIKSNVLEKYTFSKTSNEIELVLQKTLKVPNKIWSYLIKNNTLVTIEPNYIRVYKELKEFFFNTNLNPSRPISARGFYKTNKGDLYVNTQFGTAFYTKKLKEKKLKPISASKSNMSYNFLPINDSIFYCYGYRKKISQLNIKTNTYKDLTLKTSVTNSFSDIIDMDWLDKDHILVTTKKDLYTLNIKTKELKQFDVTLSNTLFNGLELTDLFYNPKSEALFIGTKNKGLLYIKADKSVFNFNTTNSTYPIVDNHINYTMQGANNYIWVGTANGLQQIDTNNMESITIVDSLGLIKNKNIVSILEDTKQNSLWIGTYNGLINYDINNTTASVFFETDGIANNEFNKSSVFKENDSTFYFGGVKGITRFNPQKKITKQNKPRLLLTELNIINTSKNIKDSVLFGLNTLKKIRLRNKEYSAILNFSITDVLSTEKIQLRYKIEGLGMSWQNFENKNKLVIKNLEPGDYKLSVQSFNTLGEITNHLQYGLRIEKYFYQTLLFKITCTLLFLLILARIYYYSRKLKNNYLKRKNEINLLKAKYLQESMNPHFISNSLNNIQSVMFTKGELVANKYINDFSKILRKTLDMNGIEKISLYNEIEYLKSYINIKTIGLNLDIKTTIDSAEDLNMQDTIIPCMLLQPIVENAIIHGLAPKKKNPELKLTFSNPNKNCLEISIEDNGVGRDYRGVNTKTNTSWSLKILEERLLIYNSLKSNYIKINTVDLTEEGNPSGTKVTIIINDSFN